MQKKRLTTNNQFRKTSDPPNSMAEGGSSRLFAICHHIYSGLKLSAKDFTCLNNLTEGETRLFLVSDENYLYPEQADDLPAPGLVWETIGAKTGGIFVRRAGARCSSESYETNLYAACMGRDLSGSNLAVGAIQPDTGGGHGLDEERVTRLIGTVARYYREFCCSEAIRRFIEDANAFLYVIDPGQKDIIFRRCPDRMSDRIDTGSLDELVLDILYPKARETAGNATGGSTLAGQVKNLSMARCAICGQEYALLSFALNAAETDHETVFPGLAHELRFRLDILKTATRRLPLKEGKAVNAADLDLMTSIKSLTGELSHIMDRLDTGDRSMALDMEETEYAG